MSRYYGHLLITFTDGTTERIGGTRHLLGEVVLTVLTDCSYGPPTDMHHFPLANIKSYRWEDE